MVSEYQDDSRLSSSPQNNIIPAGNTSSLPVDTDQVRTYLRVLYGRLSDGWIAVHFLRPEQEGPPGGRYFHVGRLEQAVRFIAAKAAQGYNTWVRVNPLRRKPTKGRGDETETVALVAVYLDIDFGTTGHKKKNLPPNREAARRLLDAVIERLGGAQPTMVVDSGHGLQAYWILETPWTFEDWREAKALLKGLNRLFAQVSQEMGFAYDGVGDLGRLLRVPSTWNLKPGCPPLQGGFATLHEGRLYKVADMRAWLAAWTALDDYRRRLETDFPRDLPRVDLDSLRVEDCVKELIRDGLAGRFKEWFPTRSEAIFRVVVAMAEAGHSPAEMLAVLMDERYGISERPLQKGRAHTETEIERILGKAYLPEVDGPGSQQEADGYRKPQGFALTDRGNALRLRDRHGRDIRWAKGIGWLVWNGQRWLQDEDLGYMRGLAADTAEHMDEEVRVDG